MGLYLIKAIKLLVAEFQLPDCISSIFAVTLAMDKFQKERFHASFFFIYNQRESRMYRNIARISFSLYQLLSEETNFLEINMISKNAEEQIKQKVFMA